MRGRARWPGSPRASHPFHASGVQLCLNCWIFPVLRGCNIQSVANETTWNCVPPQTLRAPWEYKVGGRDGKEKEQGNREWEKDGKEDVEVGRECKHAPTEALTVGSFYVLYARCAFGYGGVDCEDCEYERPALLLSTWEIDFNRIQNSIQSPKVSGYLHKEGKKMPAVCLLGHAIPCPPLDHRQQYLCHGNHRTQPKKWAGPSGHVPSQPRAS